MKTSTSKLFNAIVNRNQRLTAAQAVARFGFGSESSVRKEISRYRGQGHNIEIVNGKYSLATI